MAPFSTLPLAYQALLSSAANIEDPNTFTPTMNSLTIGYQYKFEWWSNLSGLGNQQHSATATNTLTLSDNVSAVEGGLGQHGVGAFTADATSQTVTFSAVGPLNGGSQTVSDFARRRCPSPARVC